MEAGEHLDFTQTIRANPVKGHSTNNKGVILAGEAITHKSSFLSRTHSIIVVKVVLKISERPMLHRLILTADFPY